jgi:DDRGK domain
MVDNGDSFPPNSSLGVGFSDAVLISVGFVGMGIVAMTIYSILILRSKTAAELGPDLDANDGEAAERGDDYAYRLIHHADPSKLNRTQRRLRAQAIMKQQRRIANEEQPAGIDEQLQIVPAAPGNMGVNRNGVVGGDAPSTLRQRGSRKEREKLAKALEKEERKLFENERREQQLQAQETAQRDKRNREKLEALRVEQARIQEKQLRIQKENDEECHRRIFLSSDCRSLTVDEWVQSVRDHDPTFPVVVDLQQLSESFGVATSTVHARIEELLTERRVGGVLDDGYFFYLSDDQLKQVALRILDKGAVSLKDVAVITNEILGNRSERTH